MKKQKNHQFQKIMKELSVNTINSKTPLKKHITKLNITKENVRTQQFI